MPATGHPHWFFRTADFVRLQSIAIEIICCILLLTLDTSLSSLHWILLCGLFVAIVYQTLKVFRYSSLYPRKKPNFPSGGMFSIFAANVLQTNSSYGKLIDIINEFDPDIVLTMEANKDWETALKEIESVYPYSEKIPLENFYGMLLYSKQKLHNVTSKFQIEDDVPSIFFEYEIEPNTNVFFACLHPAPPSPTENETSKERDAELMLTGKMIRELDMPTVVCGDMNDVVWSRTTRLFKKMTNMIDPRIGRGFFPTYHAGYRFMRFPLDHLFHTKDLYVKEMMRSRNFDSDHFGMYYEIHHRRNKSTTTSGSITSEEKGDVDTLIENGRS